MTEALDLTGCPHRCSTCFGTCSHILRSFVTFLSREAYGPLISMRDNESASSGAFSKALQGAGDAGKDARWLASQPTFRQKRSRAQTERGKSKLSTAMRETLF